MHMSRYQAEAQRTKSPQFFGDKVALAVFIGRVQRAIDALNFLDEVKKALFYGRHYEDLHSPLVERNCNNLQLDSLANEQQDRLDILHGILGKATEAGELLEALLFSLIENKTLDHINVNEEIGDGFWYDAILLEAIGGTFEQCAEINNAKLRKRFAEKFTETEAINRNIASEREALLNKKCTCNTESNILEYHSVNCDLWKVKLEIV